MCVVGVASVIPKPETTSYSSLPEGEKLALFKQFAYKFNRNYPSSELPAKYATFKENLAIIDSMSAKHKHAQFSITKFADISPVDFKKMYLGTHVPESLAPAAFPVAPLADEAKLHTLPASVDWRTKGAVTPVKNQGGCGSCWAFSTTGNVEGQHFLSTGKLVGLSEQNLVDCDHECMKYEGESVCDEGCNGGLMPNAMQYIIVNKGLDTEATYPYEGSTDTCSFKLSNVGATITNWTMISQNETQMAAYLYEHGPISIAADAQEWQFYIGGVFDGPCGTSLDHGILIVGYGSEIDWLGFEIDYWWVKNSWGSDWGLDGYLMIQRGVGECGLNLFACSSIIKA